jgi:hypothetical protein
MEFLYSGSAPVAFMHIRTAMRPSDDLFIILCFFIINFRSCCVFSKSLFKKSVI